MNTEIYLLIYVLGFILCWLRYVAMWNDYRHIPITYMEVAVVSSMSWVGFLLGIPYYFRPNKKQQFFQYKLKF